MYVHRRFRESESNGAHTRDREFAIDLLGHAMLWTSGAYQYDRQMTPEDLGLAMVDGDLISIMPAPPTVEEAEVWRHLDACAKELDGEAAMYRGIGNDRMGDWSATIAENLRSITQYMRRRAFNRSGAL